MAASAIPNTTTLRSCLYPRLMATRDRSLELVKPLSAEDMVVQPMDDASPTKWHLAHVTWFFETFVLAKFLPGYRVFDETFNFCFNSYYESQGARQPRGMRGLLTRPSVDRVMSYRQHVDEALSRMVDLLPGDQPEVDRLIEIGINHEEQHQELLLMDLLALFAANPLRPAYIPGKPSLMSDAAASPLQWSEYKGGLIEFGHDGRGYAWDNEYPRHQAFVRPFILANRLVTNGEWVAFIQDGGYRDADHWLADGWNMVQREAWQCPLYWEGYGADWKQMTLEGLRPLEKAAPVCNVSYFEADAFARWSGHRLPTEFEWELAARELPPHAGTFTPELKPVALQDDEQLLQMYGSVWQWTQSAYAPYPGYTPPPGAIGEYNGKFMVSQQVLRGASCITPPGHSRASYRNFFYPHQRWQFAGLRLAADI